MNKYAIKVGDKTFVRVAEDAPSANRKLANQYGWSFLSRGMCDADTRGEIWHEVICQSDTRRFRMCAFKID